MEGGDGKLDFVVFFARLSGLLEVDFSSIFGGSFHPAVISCRSGLGPAGIELGGTLGPPAGIGGSLTFSDISKNAEI